jgi:hypothetical protein
MLGRRANSIANWFSRFVRQTNLPFSLRTAHLKSLDLRMQQLQGRWHRRIEIEAKECEHAERRAEPQTTMGYTHAVTADERTTADDLGRILHVTARNEQKEEPAPRMLTLLIQ